MAFQRAVCWALKVVLSAAKGLRIGISWTEHCAQQLEDPPASSLCWWHGVYGRQAAWDRPSSHREQTTKSPSAPPQVSNCAHVNTDVTCSFPAGWVQARTPHIQQMLVTLSHGLLESTWSKYIWNIFLRLTRVTLLPLLPTVLCGR